MTDTPDLQGIALEAVLGKAAERYIPRGMPRVIADAVLAAVEPVIRRNVAEEIAKAIDERCAAIRHDPRRLFRPAEEVYRDGLAAAAAIARSHAQKGTQQ